MMARPVAHYLRCFGDEPELAPPPDRGVDFSPIPSWPQDVSEPPPDDPLLQIEAARESGRAEGLEAAREEFATELEKGLRLHHEQLEAARRKWLDEEGSTLRASLAAGLAEIEVRLAQGLSKVVTPFIIEALRKQMIEELSETIAVLIGTNETIAIKVNGPADLLDILRDNLAETPASIEYEVSENVDVSVRAEQTLIETQLSAWIARITAVTE
ncbi:MAG: hypothetical protein ACLPID_12960 [Beijerinckiaceae bacterium]